MTVGRERAVQSENRTTCLAQQDDHGGNHATQTNQPMLNLHGETTRHSQKRGDTVFLDAAQERGEVELRHYKHRTLSWFL